MFAINGQAFCGSGPGVFRLCCCTSVITAGTWRKVFGLSVTDGTTVWEFSSGGASNFCLQITLPGHLAMSADRVFVPMRRNSVWQDSGGVTATVAVLRRSDGAPLLSVDTGGTLAWCVTPIPTGGFVVGGNRNNTFPGSGGAFAHLWRFDADGSLEWFANLDDGANLTDSADDVVVASDGNLLVACRGSPAKFARVRVTDGVVLGRVQINSHAHCVDARNGEVVLGSEATALSARGTPSGWTNGLALNWEAPKPGGGATARDFDLSCAVGEVDAFDLVYRIGTSGAVSKFRISTLSSVAWGGSGSYGLAVSHSPLSEGGCVVSGARGTSWPGAAGRNANLWRWNADGTLKWFRDLDDGFLRQVQACCGDRHPNV